MPTKRVCVDLDSTIHKELVRRAKREMQTVRELTEDILRRSVIQSKARKGTTYKGPKVEKFVQYFSRYRPYSKRKKKKK